MRKARRGLAGARARLMVAIACLGSASGPALAEDAPLWTDEPVRIDRSAQDYERIAPKRVAPDLRLKVSARVTVFDSGSFAEDGEIYILTGAVPVDARRLCRGEGDGISVCGQQARIALKRLISNRTLQCDERFRAGHAHFVRCQLNGKDLAATLVAGGDAWAASPDLADHQKQAMRERRGIWTDTECRAASRCVGTGRERR